MIATRVPAPAGEIGVEPVPVWEAAHPLTLSPAMRERLRAAVRALLDHPGLDGAPDVVRLATLVLTAKSRSADLIARLTSRELGRWLGVGPSTVGHVVRPWLGQKHVARSRDAMLPGTSVVVGVDWQVLPLWEARHQQPVDHPLRLTRPDLAVLLGLMEAVCAPGWSHADGSQTAPGLLGRRTGQGAASDRLALLLLVLEARSTGVVRLCGGAVDRYGRAAATLARMLGCTTAVAAGVLARLERSGVVEVRQMAGGREQLVVPAAVDAYRAMRRARRAQGRPGALIPRPRRAVISAGGDQDPSGSAKSQVSTGESVSEAGCGSAGLHAYHSPVVTEVEESSGCGGFSGEGRGGDGRRPDRASAHEDRAVQDTVEPELKLDSAEDGALRAERQNPSPSLTFSCLGPRLSRRVPQVARILAEVVPAPSPYQRDQLIRLVDGLLLAGEDDALVAARLRARLKAMETGDPTRPYVFRRDGLSWALSIGLPYTPGGMTLVPCARRGCREMVRAKSTDTVRCNDCELVVLERKQVVLSRQQAEAAPRPATPCSRCGEPASAELCGVCWADEETEVLIAQAVAYVTGGCGEPDDPELTRVLADQAEKEARARISAACAHLTSAGGTEGSVALQARLTAQSIAHEHRATALHTPNPSPQVEAEVRSARAAQLRRGHLHPSLEAAKQAAQEAGEEARHRTAEHLLAQRSNAWLASTSTAMAPVPAARSAAHEAGTAQARAAVTTRPVQDHRAEQPANSRSGHHLVRSEADAPQAAADAEETALLRAQIAAEMPSLATITAAHHGTTYDMPPRPGSSSAGRVVHQGVSR